MEQETKMTVIRTSEDDWLEKALKLLKEKKTIILVDDKGIDLDIEDLESPKRLIKAAKEKGGISWREIVGILVSLGLVCGGFWMIKIAKDDPEPTSRLYFLIIGGIVVIVTGTVGLYTFLGARLSVILKSPNGGVFEVSPA